MNDAFAHLVGPVLQFMIEFPRRLARGEDPPLDEVRGELLALLVEAEQRAPRELAGDFALAKYALIYWIDEVLINSGWSRALDWREHILEWDFYRERLGGEAFFDRAREAEALSRTDPLEVFFLCVALGFQGKYTFSRPDLRKWAERAYGRIASGSKHPDRFLPEEPRDEVPTPLRPLPGKSILLAVCVLVSVTTLVTLACFILAVHLTA